jgi:hypothetical protein
MAKKKSTGAKSSGARSEGAKGSNAKTAGADGESAVSRASGWIAAYGAVALLTFLFQVWIRLPQCEGAGACAFSLLKGLFWALIWPTYWVIYLLSHSPWKALQGSLGFIG